MARLRVERQAGGTAAIVVRPKCKYKVHQLQLLYGIPRDKQSGRGEDKRTQRYGEVSTAQRTVHTICIWRSRRGRTAALDDTRYGLDSRDGPSPCILTAELCSRTRFSLAEILVPDGTAGADKMAPPTSTRISARLKRFQEHSSPVNSLHSLGLHPYVVWPLRGW